MPAELPGAGAGRPGCPVRFYCHDLRPPYSFSMAVKIPSWSTGKESPGEISPGV